MVEDITIPFKYCQTPTEFPQITIKFDDADGKENKEECRILTNGTPSEILIETVETSLLTRIPLLDADNLEGIFSDVRSENESSRQGISNEADKYGACTPFKRAFPERSFALIATLILELPTMFIISGGSARLCGLIGRKKYTTLIALLPLISAISGNVGLQASTLTTRAISHLKVRVDNCLAWLCKEIVAAVYLGEFDHVNFHAVSCVRLVSFFSFVLVIMT
jgi:Mg/Co/Ni transporter MgtE